MTILKDEIVNYENFCLNFELLLLINVYVVVF